MSHGEDSTQVYTTNTALKVIIAVGFVKSRLDSSLPVIQLTCPEDNTE